MFFTLHPFKSIHNVGFNDGFAFGLGIFCVQA